MLLSEISFFLSGAREPDHLKDMGSAAAGDLPAVAVKFEPCSSGQQATRSLIIADTN
jgi:hypothetical protein